MRMHYRSGTADAASEAQGKRFVFTYQMAVRFCVKRRHGRHLESVTSNW